MWAVIGIVALLLAGAILLIAIAVVAPVRVGLFARVDDRLDTARAGVRLYGGLFGLGGQIRRGTRERPTQPTLWVGPMFWRLLVPVYRIRLSARAEAAAEGEPPQAAPEEPVGETPELEERHVPPPTAAEAAEPVEEEAPAEPAPAMEPTPAGQPARVEAAAPPMAEPERGPAPAPPKAPPRGRARALYTRAQSLYRTARAQWDEWCPVAQKALRRLRGIVSIRRIALRGDLGLNDPALTGLVVGWLWALDGLDTTRVRVVGLFDGSVAMRGTVRAEVRIRPSRVWSAALCIGWAYFRHWYAARRARRAAQVAPNAEPSPASAA